MRLRKTAVGGMLIWLERAGMLTEDKVQAIYTEMTGEEAMSPFTEPLPATAAFAMEVRQHIARHEFEQRVAYEKSNTAKGRTRNPVTVYPSTQPVGPLH